MAEPTAPEVVSEIRRLYQGDARGRLDDGRYHTSGRLTQTEIASRFGLSQSTVSAMLRGATHTGQPRQRSELRARFMAKIEPEPITGCWLWAGAFSRDRPIIRGPGKATGNLRAHRVAYELFIGPIPEGLSVCHRCDTPACVNPAHLFPGDQSVNSRDMWAKDRGVSPPRHHRGRHKRDCPGKPCGCYSRGLA